MTFQQVWTKRMHKCCLNIFLTIVIYSLARQGERVRDSEVFFLSLTQGGRWKTFKDWCESSCQKIYTFCQKLSHFVRNCHILSEMVTFCQMWFSLCPQVRDEHLGLKPDRLVWLGVSYQQVSFSVSLFLDSLSCYLSSAAGISLPIQPDGRRLDVEPLTKCDASGGRRLCQSWVSIIYIHNRSGMVGCWLWQWLYPCPVLRTGPLCRCPVTQQASQWAHNHWYHFTPLLSWKDLKIQIC